MSKYGPDLQREVYQREVATEFPMSFGMWEERARDILGEAAFDYVAGGAGLEKTMRANLAAFDRWCIRPRMLRGAEERNLETSVLGTSSAAPFLLAPEGRQVDGAIGALDALPEVCEAVQGKIPVLMDSGIRTGGDIFIVRKTGK